MNVDCGDFFYLKLKLIKKERADLEVAIEDVSFSCGVSLQLPGRLDNIYTRELTCNEPTEKLNYSTNILLFVYIVLVESVPKVSSKRQSRAYHIRVRNSHMGGQKSIGHQ